MAGISKGAAGEVLAARYLRDNGYEILGANYRSRFGEIDIIATRFRYIVFVEVKTRSAATNTEKYGHAADAVTEEKKQHLRHAASRYLALHPSKKKPRFDVAEVYLPKEDQIGMPHIRYIKEAF